MSKKPASVRSRSAATAKSTAKPPRTRLDPEARKAQILDVAARMIDDEGLTEVSMDRVARMAGVSKALVYAYFSNQTTLLQELLVRDMRRIQKEQYAAATSTTTFPDMVRRTTSIALAEIEERGLFTQKLLAEPAVAAAVGQLRAVEHTANVNYLARRISEAFGVSAHDARVIVEIGLGITTAAGNYIRRTGASRAEIEDMTVAMIIGATRAAAAVKAPKPRRSRRVDR